ncbi:hypothetical protein TH25_20160 [Thalassospira profundimaris]|uniref:Uncharacterized protein n=1 Tax=Thalassospira profundimaris TaxID=502049 RepID=A0A367WS64_9PROT|nr:hypothetical protein [Thalassospira profundimaris]RCK44217.1 hypothetical protein TH25_20160 [Thalassospira profundimaris]
MRFVGQWTESDDKAGRGVPGARGAGTWPFCKGFEWRAMQAMQPMRGMVDIWGRANGAPDVPEPLQAFEAKQAKQTTQIMQIRQTTQAGQTGRRVLVVFADAPDKWLLRLLPRAFRHCFAVLETGEAGCWIYLNPASHRLECALWRFSDVFDPAAYYRARGHYCLWVTVPSDNLPRLRLGVASCVGVIKHVLGISAWWVVTPRGLYRHLANRSKICQKSS